MVKQLADLWRSLKGGDPPPASVPEGVRVYAIGDIHGRADLLAQLHDKIARHAQQSATVSENIILYIGDYVDRGPQVREVIDLIVSKPLPGFQSIHLKGNHEAMMLEFLEDATTGMAWRDAGGLETLRSYGAVHGPGNLHPADYDRAREDLEANMPETHKSFLYNLKLSATIGDYFFTHAGVRPGVDLDDQKEEDLLWIRYTFLNSTKDFGKVVVHGHTPDNNVDFKPNQIGIDTGAFMTNVLTCLVLEGTSQDLLQTD